MTIETRAIEYKHNNEVFEGALISDPATAGKAPTVLVFHDWAGRSAGQEIFGTRLAALGYTAFAVDLYGKGKRGDTPEQCQALMNPLASDRALLRDRILNAVKVVASLPEVDAAQMAAIGFCFGGLCVLDAARAGADLRGVASFHGLFGAPGLPSVSPIKAKVIAFHGWDDPMVPPADVTALGQELTAAGADWQIHAYGGTMHAFMVEGAEMPAMGMQYSARAARRSWTVMADFLDEAFQAPTVAVAEPA